jgi:hypothetical protein
LDNIAAREDTQLVLQYLKKRDDSRQHQAIVRGLPPPAPHWIGMFPHFAAKIFNSKRAGISRRSFLCRYLFNKHWIGSNAAKSMTCDIEDSLCLRCGEREDQRHIIMDCSHTDAIASRAERESTILKLVADVSISGLKTPGSNLIRAYNDMRLREAEASDAHCLYTCMFTPRVSKLLEDHPVFAQPITTTSANNWNAFESFLREIAELATQTASEHMFATRTMRCIMAGHPPPRRKTRGKLYKNNLRVKPALCRRNYIRKNSTEDLSNKHKRERHQLKSQGIVKYLKRQLAEEELEPQPTPMPVITQDATLEEWIIIHDLFDHDMAPITLPPLLTPSSVTEQAQRPPTLIPIITQESTPEDWQTIHDLFTPVSELTSPTASQHLSHTTHKPKRHLEEISSISLPTMGHIATPEEWNDICNAILPCVTHTPHNTTPLFSPSPIDESPSSLVVAANLLQPYPHLLPCPPVSTHSPTPTAKKARLGEG